MESKQLLENFLNKKYPHTEMHLSEEDKVVDFKNGCGWKLSLLLLRSKRIHCASCISRRTYSFQKAQLQWESANRAKESSRRI